MVVASGMSREGGCVIESQQHLSGALFLMPGMYAILKWYLRFYSLSFLTLVLQIWSRDQISSKVVGFGFVKVNFSKADVSASQG